MSRHGWLLLAFLTGFAARADQATIVGIGFGPSLDGSTQPHVLNLELEHDWGQLALVTNVAAIWEEPVIWVGSLVPEVKIVTPGGILLRCGVGIGWVSRTDARLSSPYEFNIQCAGGLAMGWAEILAEFNHWSDGAPILGPGPNLGRDAAFIHLGFKVF